MNQQLAQIIKQLKTIWGQLGLNQKITLMATTLAVLVGVGSLAFWSSRPSYSLLYGKLDEAEAAKVAAFLDEAKIPYQARSSGSIMVPADKVYATRMQLAAKGIPRGGDGIGFEIFDKSNFGISDFVQRANYLRAVQGELSRTISQVDSIEAARVMIVMPENRLLVNDKNKPTASVFIKVRANGQLPRQTVMAIQFLVANSVEGLQPNHVSVVDNSGNVLSDTTEPDSAVGMTQTQLEVRKRLEQYLSKKAEGMLDTVLGAGNAVVRVSAEVNFDSMTRSEEKFDPESQVLRISTTTDENTDMSTALPSGVPGVTINANGETNNLASTGQDNNRTRKKVTNSQYEINKITSNSIQSAGSISRLSAAVFIATKTEGTGATRKTVPRSKEELEKIKKIVQSALGIQEATETGRKDEITLEEFPFNDQTATEITQTLKKDQTRQFWLQLAQMCIYPALAIGVLLVLWRLLKRAPEVDIPVGVPVGDGSSFNGQTLTASGNGTNGRPNRPQPGVVTVEVLNQLIRENPQNMTQAIRGWMTRGQSK
jgi:flagellar M-ring protein FliF